MADEKDKLHSHREVRGDVYICYIDVKRSKYKINKCLGGMYKRTARIKTQSENAHKKQKGDTEESERRGW